MSDQPNHPPVRETPQPPSRAGWWWRTVLPPVVVFAVVMLAAEVAVRFGVVRPYLVPPPSRVLAALASSERLWSAFGESALSAVIGFVLSTVSGMVVAVVLSSGSWVQRAFYPYAIFFQTVPIIAIAPLLVIWFGYGAPTVIASAFIVSIFPVIANTLVGLRSTDPALLDLFRLYGATRLRTLLKLQLPAALPSILTGLRVAAGLAVVGAIVGEFVGGTGLGSVIESARTRQRVDLVFAAVLLAALLGLGLFAIINLISRFALRHWHASER